MVGARLRVKIGDELINLANLEALRCPNCGEHIDLMAECPEVRVPYFMEHLGRCKGCSGYAVMPGNGLLYLNDRSGNRYTYGEGDLQPIVKPVKDPPSLGKVCKYLRENNWRVEYDEEGCLLVKGLDSDSYRVGPAGVVYGNGPLRRTLLEALRDCSS